MNPAEPIKMDNLKDELEKQLDEAEWSWLKAHTERDAVVIVADSLDLVEVGFAIATDASTQVQSWIQSGLLSKPTLEQISAWNQMPTQHFMSLVVRPYVLIQNLIKH